MSLLSFATGRRGLRRRRSHIVPVVLSAMIAAAAIAAVTYLLWPTWGMKSPSDPSRLPVTIGNTLFNVPSEAVRIKVQRRAGPQERVDLNFVYPSLEPPPARRAVSAEAVQDNMEPIDRIFLAIAAHHDAMAPAERARTIYPRYLDPNSTQVRDGLTMRAFRDGTPYASEDIYFASAPDLFARCTRNGDTPGMCLSERRIGGADLTFRFPRDWLTQWRDVAGAMEQLMSRLQAPR